MNLKLRYYFCKDLYLIKNSEDWFNEMAQKGLQLVNIRCGIAIFKEEKIREGCYCIILRSTYEEKSIWDICNKNGWEVAAKTPKFYIFKSQNQNTYAQLHSFFQQDVVWCELAKKLKHERKIWLILILVQIIFFVNVISGRYLWIGMIEENIEMQFWFIPIWISIGINACHQYRSVNETRQFIIGKGNIVNTNKWHKINHITHLFKYVVFTIGLLIFCTSMIHSIKHKQYALTDNMNKLPYVSMMKLYQEKNFKRITPLIDSSRDTLMHSNNGVTYDWSLLAPVQYEIQEEGTIDNKEEKIRMQTKYYKLRFEWMSKPLINDLIKRYAHNRAQELHNPQLDELHRAKYNELNLIFASVDNQVIFVRYEELINEDILIHEIVAQVVK